MNRFENKTVLITGASGGIGRAIAVKFAAEGAAVAVHFNQSETSAHQTLGLLSGDSHKLFQADLTDAEQCRGLVQEVVAAFGRIDVLVNNAGIVEVHPIAGLNFNAWKQIWQRTVAANLMGPAHLSFCCIETMKRQGGGKIVNITSRGAFRGEPDAPAYGASKAGLNALSQSLAKALAPENIFVFAVAPGFVDTERVAGILNGPQGADIRHQSPLGRVAKPEEVAHTVLFLAEDGSEYLTGCIVDVNGASYLRT